MRDWDGDMGIWELLVVGDGLEMFIIFNWFFVFLGFVRKMIWIGVEKEHLFGFGKLLKKFEGILCIVVG